MSGRPQDLVSRDGSGTVFLPGATVAAAGYDSVRTSADDRAMAPPRVIRSIHCPAGDCRAICREGAVTVPIGSSGGICASRPDSGGLSPWRLEVNSTARTYPPCPHPWRYARSSTASGVTGHACGPATRHPLGTRCRCCPLPGRVSRALPERGWAGSAAARMHDTGSAPRCVPGVGKASSSLAPANRARPSGSGSPPTRPSDAAGGRSAPSASDRSGSRHPKRSRAVPACRTSPRARASRDRTRP